MCPQITSEGRARAMWRHCLASAFRTALACSVVGVTTLYGPTSFNRQVAFPAFSYVTVILIISSDVTLGDTLHGCWLALYATVQGVCPAILTLWLIGPSGVTTWAMAAVVAVSAFVVALPGNTHLISKRVALGQIVIVYVIALTDGGETETEMVMYPIHMAASTAVGVVACVLAMLLPYPSMACWEVRENCKYYTENASERLKLYVKAFTAEDKASANSLISQANSLNKPANKFLQIIKTKQESMQWEITPIKFYKSNDKNPIEKFQKLETILRGLEKALENCSDYPAELLNPELKNDLITFENPILEIENKKVIQTLQSDTKINMNNLPSLFFIFCLKLLIQTKSSTKQSLNHDSKKKFILSKIWQNSVIITIDKKRLMPAFRCALSLGLAVLFGSIYSKQNAIWSGLPVAISLAPAREATFKVANIKAQGTVLGTVYGVIGCFVFEKYVKIRFVALLPWFIFSSFLRQSKMYGQAGGVSAVIGAVLVLGRKNFGEPSDFAIARIVETFIGLSCSIAVDTILQPRRASVLAKTQLSKTLRYMRECVGSITIYGSSSGKLVSLEENLNKLKCSLNELGKLIEEADAEPDFWFLPFHSGCYGKLRLSFSRMVDFLIFCGNAVRVFEKESEKMEGKIWKEAVVNLESDLKVLRDAVCSRIKCFEEVSLVKSLVLLEREYEKWKSDVNVDLEMGRSGRMCANQRSGLFDEDEMKMMKECEFSLLEKLGGVVSHVTNEEVKNEVVLSLSSLVFCMDGLLSEIVEIEKGIKEILQWENPSVQVDLHGIVRKMHAL